MVHRLEIAIRPPLPDPRGRAIAATVRAFLGIPVAAVRTRDVHRVEADLSEADARRVLQDISAALGATLDVDRSPARTTTNSEAIVS